MFLNVCIVDAFCLLYVEKRGKGTMQGPFLLSFKISSLISTFLMDLPPYYSGWGLIYVKTKVRKQGGNVK